MVIPITGYFPEFHASLNVLWDNILDMATFDGLGGIIVPQAYQKVATMLGNVVHGGNVELYIVHGPEDAGQLLGGVLQLVDGPITRSVCAPCEDVDYPLDEGNIVPILDPNQVEAWPINIFE